MSMVTLRCLRPARFEGEAVRPGDRVDATLLQAAELLGSTRFELLRPADAAAVRAAREREDMRLTPPVRAPSNFLKGFL
jgi:hypothetical protein